MAKSKEDEISHLRAAVFDMAEWALAGFKGEMDESDALCQINNRGRKILNPENTKSCAVHHIAIAE